ncbi:hypothetical protein [Pseudomonas sp. G(2018)]|jgi:hypothetical protein|uniref:hypothetical protein n=1 Tax=Pseudomonas sp. G(2018) TaxID=2502242 RepID=UPI0010F9348B|nr:hypothetical protein [Pseudomonas sp. G(2018)]
MRIYRGPSSKPFWHSTHELVSTIDSEELEASIANGTGIGFDINKDGTERKAVCTVCFDKADIIPIIRGLLVNLEEQQKALHEVKGLVKDAGTSNEEKLRKIGALVGLPPIP